MIHHHSKVWSKYDKKNAFKQQVTLKIEVMAAENSDLSKPQDISLNIY